MDRYVIIVAGGNGVRMGSDIPKQFMLLGTRPLLMYSISAFFKVGIEKIILVLPLQFIEYWKSICKEYSFDIPHKVVQGGLFRSESVKNGLDAIKENEAIVAVHDGVRPFVSQETILKGYEIAEHDGTAVPYVDITDSLRAIEGAGNVTVERDKYKTVQTPQCFKLSLLRKAYNNLNLPAFTDDAALVERLDVPIILYKGNLENIKITEPFDLLVAEAILKVKG